MQDPGLRGVLEGLFGRPLGAHRQSEGPLVLLLGFEGVGQVGCQVFDILLTVSMACYRSED